MQAGGDEGMFKENNKKFEVLDGSIEFKVTSVNAELGEFGGVFVQKQPSDTDLGSKVSPSLNAICCWLIVSPRDALCQRLLRSHPCMFDRRCRRSCCSREPSSRP